MNEITIVPNLKNFETLSKEEIRSFIAQVEIEVGKVEQIEAPLTHHFSKGVYARELFIPKGSIIVGKIHKYENLNILSSGELSIISVDGCFRVKAPFTVVSSPGVKRMAYAHEDSIWTTVHGTEETDVDKIEEIFIAKTYEDVPALNNVIELNVLEFKEAKWLGQR